MDVEIVRTLQSPENVVLEWDEVDSSGRVVVERLDCQRPRIT
jgi:hypothetical protein